MMLIRRSTSAPCARILHYNKRVVPRDFLLPGDRGQFGKDGSLTWLEVESVTDRGALAAAQRQHRASIRVRWLIKNSSNLSGVGAFAYSLHTNAEGLRRKLRGENWASLVDLGLWSVALNDSTVLG